MASKRKRPKSKQMPEIDAADAEKLKQAKQVKKEIKALYEEVAKDFEKEIRNLSKDGNISAAMKKTIMSKHVKMLEREIDRLDSEISSKIQSSMKEAAQSVVDANNQFMARLGLDLKGAFSYVPNRVIERLISGKVYEGRWTLSTALWKGGKKTKEDIAKIVAKGLAANKSTYDIAKDLEKYVKPSAKKTWEWSKVYPGTNKVVDYNAQRLARTLIQHSYQEAYDEVLGANPFVDGVIWRSAFAPTSCEICMERDGTYYRTGDEPFDHPMGLCYLEPTFKSSFDSRVDVGKNGAYGYKGRDTSMQQIANELVDWAHGKSNPAIDRYVSQAKRE